MASTSNKTETVKAGLGASVAKFFSGDISFSYDSNLTSKNVIQEMSYRTRGGIAGKGLEGAIDFSAGALPKINLGLWAESCKDYKQMIGADPGTMIPLYELVKDPAKKAALKSEILSYLKSQEIVDVEGGGITALHRYYNTSTRSHVFIANWNELGSGKDASKYESIACYVYPYQAPNTVPLYRYYNTKTQSHVFIANFDEIGTGKDDWKYEKIECYVYAAP